MMDKFKGRLPAAFRDLTCQRRWVLWRFEKDEIGSNPRKVPYSGTNQRRAKSNDASTWSTLDRCAELHRALPGHYEGVGVMLGELDDGRYLVGVEFDTCRDTEDRRPRALSRSMAAQTQQLCRGQPKRHGREGVGALPG